MDAVVVVACEHYCVPTESRKNPAFIKLVLPTLRSLERHVGVLRLVDGKSKTIQTNKQTRKVSGQIEKWRGGGRGERVKLSKHIAIA